MAGAVPIRLGRLFFIAKEGLCSIKRSSGQAIKHVEIFLLAIKPSRLTMSLIIPS